MIGAMSLDEALELSGSLWSSLAITGRSGKGDAAELFPKFTQRRIAESVFNCPLCEYVGYRTTIFGTVPYCEGCPIEWGSEDGRCDERGAPYHSWENAECAKDRAAAAARVRDLIYAKIDPDYEDPQTEFDIEELTK